MQIFPKNNEHVIVQIYSRSIDQNVYTALCNCEPQMAYYACCCGLFPSYDYGENKRFVFQGLIVILTNPKIFFFLGSFLPQFISLDNSVSYQIIYFGVLFILIATICDSCYALIFGKFRNLIVNKYLKILNLIGGLILILVGVWLLFY